MKFLMTLMILKYKLGVNYFSCPLWFAASDRYVCIADSASHLLTCQHEVQGQYKI